MEHTSCCQRVIWELERCEDVIEDLKDKLETYKNEAESLKYQLEDEKKFSGQVALSNFDLRDENKKLKNELERSVEQMAELEMQMRNLAERYNDLARESKLGGKLICDFEPVREEADLG